MGLLWICCFSMYVVQGAWASLLLYIRWEIRTDSKVPLGFATNANETTVGIKQNAQNSLHWYCNMATKHLQLLVSNAKLHLNDLMMSFLQIPPTDKPRAFANIGMDHPGTACASLRHDGPIQHPAGRILL